MGFAKERKRLEKLSEKTVALQHFDSKNAEIITDIFDQYSHTIRILKNKNIDLFNELYLHELQQTKEHKKTLKLAEDSDDRETLFLKYKEALLNAINKTIDVTNKTV